MLEKKDYWKDRKTVRIGKKLHTKLKIMASQKNMKMEALIEELINKSLEEKGEKKDGSN